MSVSVEATKTFIFICSLMNPQPNFNNIGMMPSKVKNIEFYTNLNLRQERTSNLAAVPSPKNSEWFRPQIFVVGMISSSLVSLVICPALL